MSKYNSEALTYHEYPTPGKIEIVPTKPLMTQHDLSLAYTPGVAQACQAIVEDVSAVDRLTSRHNMVAVITNGTAVLGLGNIGPFAAKPVMEGKAVLFKKFANVDSIDLESSLLDPDAFIEAVASLEASFGGINLEDIKAPECFYIEETLKKRMNIPVFHDDQHGTAVIVSAAVINALILVNKKIEDIKCVVSGAGAAAMACLNLLVKLGMSKKNIFVCDRSGVITEDRDSLTVYKARYAQDTSARTLDEVIEDADLFLGLSAAGALKPEMVAKMAKNPIILALANPVPEILPEEALKVRKDILIGTGRSDFPNQVNNVLCFPFLFRGTLDVGSVEITDGMKLACAHAIAKIARDGFTDIVGNYNGINLEFGPNYFIPKPFDPRLFIEVSYAVAKEAMDSGVAKRPLSCLDTYKQHLTERAYKEVPAFRCAAALKNNSCQIYLPLKENASANRAVLNVAKGLVRYGVARPVLLGKKKAEIQAILEEMELPLNLGQDCEVLETFPTDSKATSSALIGPVSFIEKELRNLFTCDTLKFSQPLGWLHGYATEKSAIFSCESVFPEMISLEDKLYLVKCAINGIKALKWKPHLLLCSSFIEDAAEKDPFFLELLKWKSQELDLSILVPNEDIERCEEGLGYLLINHSFPLTSFTGIAYRGVKMGPFLIGHEQPWQIFSSTMSAHDIIELASFSLLKAYATSQSCSELKSAHGV